MLVCLGTGEVKAVVDHRDLEMFTKWQETHNGKGSYYKTIWDKAHTRKEHEMSRLLHLILDLQNILIAIK